jgi:hypothetical protein
MAQVVEAWVPALERSAGTAAELQAGAERAGDGCLQGQIEERLGTLLRPSFGLGNRAPVEVTARGQAATGAGDRDRDGRAAQDENERDRQDTFIEPPEGPLYTPRMNERALQKDLDRQIITTHRRFVKAMDGRLGSMSLENKERYFAVLSSLVGKLETNGKSLREIMQEMMTETASLILQEMQS